MADAKLNPWFWLLYADYSLSYQRCNRTGYVKVRAKPGCACVTALCPHHVNMLTHPHKRFKRQPLLLIFTGFMHKR